MQYITSSKIGNLVHFAASYDCNAYGAGTYNNDTCSTATGANTGILPDTGYNIIIPVAFALALIIAASILFFKKAMRRRKKASLKL
jgi:LPXTG-motif cell wall-anchored protein